MQRRTMMTLVASTLAASAAGGRVLADSDEDEGGDLDASVQQFLALPGTKSFLLEAGDGGSAGRIAHQPGLPLFIASTYKTFVLGQYLRDVDAGRLSEDEELPINDSIRTLGSPVYLDLTGTTPARSVLEAMITHSDNTATDAATLKVGADRIRALIAQAGLQITRIPDSTRIAISYVLGAPAGVDLGWAGIQQAVQNPPGPLRPLINDRETFVSSANDMVSWYSQALRGAFFSKPETLKEFKRIHAAAYQIIKTVPPRTVAYAKGGEASVNGFNAKGFAGQMIVGKGVPVTFCFIVNWQGPESTFPGVEAAYFAAIAGILRRVKREIT